MINKIKILIFSYEKWINLIIKNCNIEFKIRIIIIIRIILIIIIIIKLKFINISLKYIIIIIRKWLIIKNFKRIIINI